MNTPRHGRRVPALLDVATWMLAAIAVCGLSFRRVWGRMSPPGRWRKNRKSGNPGTERD